MEGSIKVIIAEDAEKYRQQIILHVNYIDPNIEFIAEASNGTELLLHLETLRPDIILLDLEMPTLDGNKTMTILRSTHPEIKVVIFSSYDDEYLIDDYMLRGAKGYLSKDEVSDNPNILVHAVKRVHAGGVYRSKGKTRREKKITARQVEIINLSSENKSFQEIADTLNVKRDSIYKQEKTIKEKLGVKKGTLKEIILSFGLNFMGKRFSEHFERKNGRKK